MANEKRLMDVNAALEKVCENCCCNFEECKRIGFCVDYTNIEQLPTVDAVEVVRCKDCKHYNQAERWCDYHGYYDHVPVDENDFCSYGERRTE